MCGSNHWGISKRGIFALASSPTFINVRLWSVFLQFCKTYIYIFNLSVVHYYIVVSLYSKRNVMRVKQWVPRRTCCHRRLRLIKTESGTHAPPPVTWGMFGSLLSLARIASGIQAAADQAMLMQTTGIWLPCPAVSSCLVACSFHYLTVESRGACMRACGSQTPKKRKWNPFPGMQPRRTFFACG
jgi:hypothetical protein